MITLWNTELLVHQWIIKGYQQGLKLCESLEQYAQMRCLQDIKLGGEKHYDTDCNVDIQRKCHNDYFNRQGAYERKKKKSEKISYFSHIQRLPIHARTICQRKIY